MMLSSCCHQSVPKKSGVNWACEDNRTIIQGIGRGCYLQPTSCVFCLATIHRVQDLCATNTSRKEAISINIYQPAHVGKAFGT